MSTILGDMTDRQKHFFSSIENFDVISDMDIQEAKDLLCFCIGMISTNREYVGKTFDEVFEDLFSGYLGGEKR